MKRGIRFLAAFLSVVMIAGQSLPALAETGLSANQEVVTENEGTETPAAASETSEAEVNESSTQEEQTEDKKTEEQPSDEKPETEEKEKENTSDEIEKPEKEETAEEEETGKDSAEKESDPEAEKTDVVEESEKEQTEYDASYITAFAPLANTEFHYEYKLGLERLLENFPTSIAMTLGGTVTYDYSVSEGENEEDTEEYKEGNREDKQDIRKILEVNGGTEVVGEVTWKCIQNYDENLGAYDFVPDLGNAKLIEGVKLPQITVIVEEEGDGATGGYIPEVKDYEIPVLENTADNRDFSNAALTGYYNGYEEGYLPAVRDQGSEGACWAFASIGAMEADLLKDGRVSNVDMAELHAAYFSVHDVTDPKGCRTDRVQYTGSNYLSNGGCDELTYRSMASLIGPVEEDYMPYSRGKTYVPDGALAMNFDYAALKGAYQINVEDHDSIKQAILDHGAVTASYYSSEGNFSDSAGNTYQVRYSATNNSFYGQLPRTNHRVMIVGWDDNFSRDNFYEGCKPQQDGAWLVRNSWGLNDYGNRGYFWLSYYDCGLLSSSSMVAYDMDFDGYDHVYGYNGTWLCASYSFSNQVEVTESFQVTGNEEVTAIGIETGSSNLSMEVSVSDGTQTATGSTSTTLAGFYVIPLRETLKVGKGSTVELTIHISSEESTIKLICDYTYNNYGNLNFIASKDSDVKANGWEVPNDLVIKMYTDDNASQTVKTARLKEDSICDHAGTQKQLELTTDSTISMKDITWKSLEETVATVDSNGLVTIGAAKGSTKVIGTCPDGSIISCDVKVQPYRIKYVIPDDTKIIRMDTEYYPGDSAHCKLPVNRYCGIYRQGFTLNGWCRDEALTQTITDADLMTMAEDITVYPVWKELFINLYYYGVDDNANYTTSSYTASGSIYTSSLPYDLKNLTRAVSNVTNMLKSYNATHEPLQFSYWSLDPEGKQRIDQLTVDSYNMRLSNAGTEYAYYTQTQKISLYPQFKTSGVPSVEQVALLLGGRVGVNFYCDLSGLKEDVLKNGYVVLSSGHYDKTIPISKAGKETENGTTFYVFNYEVAAKEMSQDINLSVYDGAGQALTLENGNEADVTVFTYSVYEYLNAAENLTDTSHLALTRAMAAYGVMSESVFNGRTTDDAMLQLRSVIGDTQASDVMSLLNNVSAGAVADYERAVSGTLPEGLTYYGTSLVLESGTAIRHYFKVAPGYSISRYGFTCGSAVLTPVKVNDHLYYVESAKNIPAVQYRNAYTVTVGGYSLSYSVYSYVYAVLKGSHSDDLNNVVKAMYLYGEAAGRYFN